MQTSMEICKLSELALKKKAGMSDWLTDWWNKKKIF